MAGGRNRPARARRKPVAAGSRTGGGERAQAGETQNVMGTTSETHQGTVTLIDTCLLIRALEKNDPAANAAISGAQSHGRAVVNVVVLAEICAGSDAPEEVSAAVRSLGVQVVEIPEAAAAVCGRAFSNYLERRGNRRPRVQPRRRCRIFSSARTRKSWAGRWPRATKAVSKLISPGESVSVAG